MHHGLWIDIENLGCWRYSCCIRSLKGVSATSLHNWRSISHMTMCFLFWKFLDHGKRRRLLGFDAILIIRNDLHKVVRLNDLWILFHLQRLINRPSVWILFPLISVRPVNDIFGFTLFPAWWMILRCVKLWVKLDPSITRRHLICDRIILLLAGDLWIIIAHQYLWIPH